MTAIAPWTLGDPVAALWRQDNAATFALSQARHAQTIMLGVLARRGNLMPTLWLPAFYGRSMIAPLRAGSARIVFYPMTLAMNPDWAALETLAASGPPPDIFFLAHFYGVEAEALAARHFADRHGALLFEDTVHFMLPAGDVGRHSDFACYSPRKYFESPDGAVLTVRTEALADEVEALAATLDSPPPRLLRKRWTAWRDRHLPWRRRSGALPKRDFDSDDWWSDPTMSPSIWMSGLTRAKIERAGIEGTLRIAAKELAIVERLEREVPRLTGLAPVPRRAGTSPYLVGFRGKSRDDTQRAHHALSEAGATVATWPDLPEEIRAEPSRYGAALELRNTIIRLVPRYFARRDPLDFLRRMKPLA